MIMVNKSDAPNNKKELLVVENSVGALSAHMEMLREALIVLLDNFVYSKDKMQNDTNERSLFLNRYEGMSAQANIAYHLFAECYDYVCLLCGESNNITRRFDRTAECRQFLQALTKADT